MGFGESGGVETVSNSNELPEPGKPGKPNARYDLVVPGGKGPKGQKMSRWTDANGEPLRDKDYNHGGVKHQFPHYHEWINGIRK